MSGSASAPASASGADGAACAVCVAVLQPEPLCVTEMHHCTCRITVHTWHVLGRELDQALRPPLHQRPRLRGQLVPSPLLHLGLRHCSMRRCLSPPPALLLLQRRPGPLPQLLLPPLPARKGRSQFCAAAAGQVCGYLSPPPLLLLLLQRRPGLLPQQLLPPQSMLMSG